MTRIVIAGPGRTYLESVVEAHPAANLDVLHSKAELQELLDDTSRSVDLVVTGLTLSPATPTRAANELYVQQDALRLVRHTVRERPGVRFAICSPYWHVRLATRSYEDGACWFVRDHPGLGADVVDGLVKAAAGAVLEPYGLEVSMANQWTASRDARLREFSVRDLEVLEALLVDPEYTDALVARLGFASRNVAYMKISRLVQLGAFDNREALIAHALDIGLQPVDRARSGFARLVEASIRTLYPSARTPTSRVPG